MSTINTFGDSFRSCANTWAQQLATLDADGSRKMREVFQNTYVELLLEPILLAPPEARKRAAKAARKWYLEDCRTRHVLRPLAETETQTHFIPAVADSNPSPSPSTKVAKALPTGTGMTSGVRDPAMTEVLPASHGPTQKRLGSIQGASRSDMPPPDCLPSEPAYHRGISSLEASRCHDGGGPSKQRTSDPQLWSQAPTQESSWVEGSNSSTSKPNDHMVLENSREISEQDRTKKTLATACPADSLGKRKTRDMSSPLDMERSSLPKSPLEPRPSRTVPTGHNIDWLDQRSSKSMLEEAGGSIAKRRNYGSRASYPKSPTMRLSLWHQEQTRTRSQQPAPSSSVPADTELNDRSEPYFPELMSTAVGPPTELHFPELMSTAADPSSLLSQDKEDGCHSRPDSPSKTLKTLQRPQEPKEPLAEPLGCLGLSADYWGGAIGSTQMSTDWGLNPLSMSEYLH